MPIKLDTMERELKGKGRGREGERKKQRERERQTDRDRQKKEREREGGRETERESKILTDLWINLLTLSWPASGYLTSKVDCFADISCCACRKIAKTTFC